MSGPLKKKNKCAKAVCDGVKKINAATKGETMHPPLH